MTHPALLLLSLLTLVVLAFNFVLPLVPDEAYYWAWSQHLALSYYDGAPMIAYLIRISTSVFGNNAFAVKLVSVFCYSGAAYLMYRFSLKLFDARTAFIALCLFLFSPAIQVGYAITTYDAPQILFWMATLYTFYVAMDSQKARYFYLSGLCAGLLLLSKYTGILLLASLALYLLCTSAYRRSFKNIHLYLALALAFIIFSPVIYWNQQHQWVSFLFQLQHGQASSAFSFSFLGAFLGGQALLLTPVFFIGALILLALNAKTIWQQPKLRYLLFPFAFTFLFFLYKACFVHSELNWAAPAYISLIMLVAYLIQARHYFKFYYVCLLTLLLFTLLIRVPILTSSIAASRHFFLRLYGYQEMMQQASNYIQPGDLVLSDSYQDASMAYFYLAHQTQAYILSPKARFSSYNYWSAPLTTQKLNSAWYIGEQAPDLSAYFSSCEFIQTLTYQSRYGSKQLLLYHCSNSLTYSMI